MKNKLYVFLISFIFILPLSADKIYVHVGDVIKVDLFNVVYDLKELGYKAFTKEKTKSYSVYIGPFENMDSANKVLKRVQKNVSKKAYLIKETTKKMKVNKVKTEDKKRSYFMGLNVGGTQYEIEEKKISGNLQFDTQLEPIAFSYGVEMGYNFNENIFSTINYQHKDNKNIKMDIVYLGLDYKINYFKLFQPYVGILGGYNVMSWKEYPIDSSVKDIDAYSFSAGVELGFEVPISSGLSTYMTYQYIQLDLTTIIGTSIDSTTIKHSSEQDINFGVRFAF